LSNNVNSPIAGRLAFYVASWGSDSHAGTADQPFATLARARDAVRALDKRLLRGVTVHLEAGTYRLTETLRFCPVDSGTPTCPVTYAAMPGQSVIVSGSCRLECHWELWRDGIWRCPVPEAASGHLDFSRLFVNGVLQVRARYPNYDPTGDKTPGFSGHCYAGSSYSKPGHCYPTAQTPWPENRELSYDPSTFTARQWARPEEGVLHVFAANYWGNMQFQLAGRDDTKLLLGRGGWQLNALYQRQGATGIDQRSAFFVENIFEELDAPGEWYLDKREGWLYLMPELGVALATAVVEVPVLQRLVELRGEAAFPVRHIHFEGIHFTGSEVTYLEPYETPSLGDWSIHRGGALFFENAENCELRNCEFSGLGGNAVFFNHRACGIRVADSHFHGIGESAICLVGKSHLDPSGKYRCPHCDFDHAWGWGEESGEIPTDCVIVNNTIHGIGLYGKQTAGVFLSLSNRIAIRANHIFNTPRAAICINDGFHGGHLIEDNDIHDTVLETGDHGPFNSWGREPFWCDAQSHGPASHPAGDVLRHARETTIVRHNRFRDRGGWGIDLDDGSSNYHVYNNLCIGISVKLREGDFRLVENNIFIHPANPPGAHCGFENNSDVFRFNIVLICSGAENREGDVNFSNDDSAGSVVSLILPPAKGTWFKDWDRNLYFSDLGAFRANVCHYSEGKRICRIYDLSDWQKLEMDVHSLYADPLFKDVDGGDYRLLAGSPALALGFRSFDTVEFGPQPRTAKKY